MVTRTYEESVRTRFPCMKGRRELVVNEAPCWVRDRCNDRLVFLVKWEDEKYVLLKYPDSGLEMTEHHVWYVKE